MEDVVRIADLKVSCVVGVHRHERGTPQPLTIDVALRLDTEAAARNERLRETVDYAATRSQIVFLLQSCRFRLLETAAHVLAAYLLLPPGGAERAVQVRSVRLRLTKPDALEGNGIPSLEIERDAGWAKIGYEEKPFGTVDIVHETRDSGVYRLNIAPHASIPLHVHRTMREAEMVLGDGLLCQGKAVQAGSVHRWPHDAPHTYENTTDRWQSILCVDSPPFIEADELVVEGTPADVPAESRLTWSGRKS